MVRRFADGIRRKGRIMKRKSKSAALGLVAAAALVGVGAPAGAEGGSQEAPPVQVVATGLEGPFGLGAGSNRLYVAESGDGQITKINPVTGRTEVVARGLPSPAGVDKVGRSLVIVTGGAEDP